MLGSERHRYDEETAVPSESSLIMGCCTQIHIDSAVCYAPRYVVGKPQERHREGNRDSQAGREDFAGKGISGVAFER